MTTTFAIPTGSDANLRDETRRPGLINRFRAMLAAMERRHTLRQQCDRLLAHEAMLRDIGRSRADVSETMRAQSGRN